MDSVNEKLCDNVSEDNESENHCENQFMIFKGIKLVKNEPDYYPTYKPDIE